MSLTVVPAVLGAPTLNRAVPAGEATPLYLRYERTVTARRPIDAVNAPGDRFFVLEQRGSLLAFDKETLQVVKGVKVPEAIALTRDPESGTLFILGMTAKRGPWQTIYAIDPQSFTAKLLCQLQGQYAFNEHGVGFAVDRAGRHIVNNRYTRDQPALVVVDPKTGAITSRIALPGEKSASSGLDDKVISRWNAYRLRLSGDTLFALNVTTGSMAVLDIAQDKVASSFDLPRAGSWHEPKLTDDGGVAVTYAVFDFAVDQQEGLFVLSNGRDPVGFVVEQNGQVRHTLKVSPQSTKLLAGNYDSILLIGPGKLLLISSMEGRLDLFSLSAHE